MILYGFLIIFSVFAAYLCLCLVETDSLRSKSDPALNYEDSMRRIDELAALDTPDVADYGHAIIMTHGQKTERAIVFYHGYTNCPRQYEKLAKQFFEKGYNVYVPRVPHNGLKDFQTKEIGKLTIGEIMEVCDSSVSIAQGLGEKVTVFGLSMGGVMAAWNAQFCDNVDLAVVVVPSFGWCFLPGIVKPLVNLIFLFPNFLLWWDPVKKDRRDAPYSMYHKFATHGMGHIMRFGLSVLREAKKRAPKAGRVLVLTNEIDIAVDEANIQCLMRHWRKFGADVSYYQFSKDLKMEHDIIDPLHPYDQTDVVYTKIFELIE